MELVLYIIITGFLVRADGWGTDDPKYQRVAKFFNVWSCGGLFAVLTLVLTGLWLVSLVAGAAFIVWRMPGFNGWEKYWNMFARGAWTSFIGFTSLSYAAHGFPYCGWVFVPFSFVYAAIYAGGYKYLPNEIEGFGKHAWIEHASGWAFAIATWMIF